MRPILQVRMDELPYRPEALGEVALFTVYIDHEELPLPSPALNGDRWLLRAYPSLEGLERMPEPELETWVRPFPIQWELLTGDAPGWQDVCSVVDLEDFNRLDEADPSIEPVRLFYDRYRTYYRTKIGGWPALIQNSLEDGADFVFQIGSEEKANWMWGDNGIAYFSVHPDGRWTMDWQCY